MRIPERLRARLAAWGEKLEAQRLPDRVIGRPDSPYFLRWHVLKTPFLSVYWHLFLRSDDPRALHNHPELLNISVIVKGHYRELMPVDPAYPAGEAQGRARGPGDIVFRLGGRFHRIALYGWPERPCRTVFIESFDFRNSGFACPGGRFVPWREFTQAGPTGASDRVGRGCE